MKFSKIVGAVVWMTVSTAAIAQTGGGLSREPFAWCFRRPKADGSLRYGREPVNRTNSPVGLNSSSPERPKAEETAGSDRLVACEYRGVLRYSSQGFMN
jgi:hypothetical protein